MARRAGTADLPLHGGRVPQWLADRMTRLGAVMAEAIVLHYGRDELLRRLAHPFWFQSFGAVMGMDWHSSGITTSVIGALKRGLEPLSGELGLHVCGGRGKHSRKTPDELIGDRREGRLRRRGARAREPAGRQGRQRRGAGRLRSLSARLHRRRRRPLDGGAAGDERRRAPGAPLSLAFRGVDELRRRAACGDRGRGPGRDRQPRRPSRRKPRARARSRCSPNSRRTRSPPNSRGSTRRPPSRSAAGATRPAASRHAGPSRRARRRTSFRAASPARSPPPPRRGRATSRNAAGNARRRRAHRARAGAGRRSAARRALPLQRSGAPCLRPRRQGPPPVSGADQGLRPDDRRAEIGGRQGQARPRRGTRRAEAPRRAGAPAGAQRVGAVGRGADRRGARAPRRPTAGGACSGGRWKRSLPDRAPTRSRPTPVVAVDELDRSDLDVALGARGSARIVGARPSAPQAPII